MTYLTPHCLQFAWMRKRIIIQQPYLHKERYICISRNIWTACQLLGTSWIRHKDDPFEHGQRFMLWIERWLRYQINILNIIMVLINHHAGWYQFVQINFYQYACNDFNIDTYTIYTKIAPIMIKESSIPI